MRPYLPRATPVHVTLSCRRELGRLRRRAAFRAVRDALAVTVRRVERFRVVHVSIQHNHLHLLVEASDRAELSRGMQGFSISCARRLNRHLGRSGRVFAERYHAQPISSPRHARNEICYVLNNWRHHGSAGSAGSAALDPFSSALAFDGWARPSLRRIAPGAELLPTAFPRFWLITTGWRRHGLIDPAETPGLPAICDES